MTAREGGLRAARAPNPLAILRSQANACYWPLAGIAFVLLLQLSLVFGRAINWDEFYHYAQVQLFTEGQLSQPLQTFYVRVFQWLPALPGSNVDHIVVARLFMFGCEIVAAAAIAILAARFSSRTIGLLCALCYLSAGFVLQHGFSFRADSVDAALLMSALCILGCTRLRPFELIALGALVALAAIFTIKFVLYAPAFLGLAWLRWHEHGYRIAFLYKLLAAAAAAVAVFALLFAYHTQAGPEVARSSQTVLQSSAGKMFQVGIPFYWIYIVKAAMLAPIFALLIVAAPFAVKASDLSPPSKIALGGLFAPIAALAFYHNTAPYFYTFILPPIAVACAVPMALAVERFNVAALTAGLAGVALLIWAAEDRGIIDRQRTLLAAADEIFPERISYFDFCAMLAGHDKANVFMTPWGGEKYRRGSVPSMREVMRTRVVPLVVENDPMFTRLLRTNGPAPEFLADDVVALRETYFPFWGPFWVAGKAVPADTRQRHVEILVPGPYTLAGGALEIDGKLVRAGQVVALGRGRHRLTAIDGKAARLTWGDHLARPAEAPPPEPFWIWF